MWDAQASDQRWVTYHFYNQDTTHAWLGRTATWPGAGSGCKISIFSRDLFISQQNPEPWCRPIDRHVKLPHAAVEENTGDDSLYFTARAIKDYEERRCIIFNWSFCFFPDCGNEKSHVRATNTALLVRDINWNAWCHKLNRDSRNQSRDIGLPIIAASGSRLQPLI